MPMTPPDPPVSEEGHSQPSDAILIKLVFKREAVQLYRLFTEVVKFCSLFPQAFRLLLCLNIAAFCD